MYGGCGSGRPRGPAGAVCDSLRFGDRLVHESDGVRPSAIGDGRPDLGGWVHPRRPAVLGTSGGAASPRDSDSTTALLVTNRSSLTCGEATCPWTQRVHGPRELAPGIFALNFLVRATSVVSHATSRSVPRTVSSAGPRRRRYRPRIESFVRAEDATEERFDLSLDRVVNAHGDCRAAGSLDDRRCLVDRFGPPVRRGGAGDTSTRAVDCRAGLAQRPGDAAPGASRCAGHQCNASRQRPRPGQRVSNHAVPRFP